MKSKLIALALGAIASFAAVAGPATSLPGGPLYMKFNGNEQIAVGGATTYTDATHTGEINWGVFTMTTMEIGSVINPRDTIGGTGDIFFANVLTNNAQVTGMFYDVKAGTNPTAANPFPATGGFMDLYWRDLSVMTKTINTTSGPGVRCGWNCATGYTEGTFLGRLMFASGIDPANVNNFIAGTTIPTSGAGFTGQANSFANIDLTAGGLWATKLDTDYFDTFNGATRDLRFKNSYEQNATWDGGPGIIGARLDDPAQAMALPEPGILSLMGLSLIGMGVIRRRRQK